MKHVNAPKVLAIFLSVLTLFLMVRVFMTDLEKRELNHRFEDVIEQYEQLQVEIKGIILEYQHLN